MRVYVKRIFLIISLVKIESYSSLEIQILIPEGIAHTAPLYKT